MNLPPPVEPNQPGPSFDLDDIVRRLSPQAQLEVSNALLTIQLEQAHAHIAELESGQQVDADPVVDADEPVTDQT